MGSISEKLQLNNGGLMDGDTANGMDVSPVQQMVLLYRKLSAKSKYRILGYLERICDQEADKRGDEVQ